MYNYYDSYPSGLGLNLVNEIILSLYKDGLENWKELLEKIKVVYGDVKPTKRDIENLRPYTDLGVSCQSVDDWYCLTRHLQGSMERVLKSVYLLQGGLSRRRTDVSNTGRLSRVCICPQFRQ
jgi:hypothetical protein